MFNVYKHRERERFKSIENKKLWVEENLKERREILSLKGHERMQNWMNKLKQEDAKAIADGAIKKSVIIAEVQDIDSNIIDRALLKRGDSTYYNRMYVRNYEPEIVKRVRKGSVI